MPKDWVTTALAWTKKPLIAGNIVSAIGTLVREMSFVQENQLHDIEELSEAVGRLSRMPNFPQESNAEAMRYDEKLVLDRADDIKLLWDSEPIQTTYKRRNEFQIVECARYFLSKVHEVMEPDYVPTDDDILQIRIQTIGINEHVFNMKGGGANRKLIMIDVGGQRTERKKWIHFFDDVKVLMFLAAISEYDQVLAEDGRTNRLKESVNLFHTILNYQWFRTTHCVLFLNKKDLLEEKINSGRNPVQNFFPDCPSNEYPVAEEYFKQLFIAQNPNPEVRDIYPHVTCATDQNNIKVVDTAVQVVIMRLILGDLGVH